MNHSSALTDNEDTTDQEEFNETNEDRQSKTKQIISNDKPTPCRFNSWEFSNSTSKKRARFFKITKHPDILKRNNAGKIVVFEKLKPSTNFNTLFTSMVGPTRDSIQFIIETFFEALRRFLCDLTN